MSEEVVRFTLRLPEGLHKGLSRDAKSAHRSIHAHMLHLLEQSTVPVEDTSPQVVVYVKNPTTGGVKTLTRYNMADLLDLAGEGFTQHRIPELGKMKWVPIIPE